MAKYRLPFSMLTSSFAGLVQAVGLFRWVFVVPILASIDESAAANSSTKETVDVVFQMINRFAGVEMGEHLGYLFSAIWTLMVCYMMRKAAFHWALWSIGSVTAIMLLFGLLEPVGDSTEFASTIVSIGYILWALWLICFGIYVLYKQRKTGMTRSDSNPTKDPRTANTDTGASAVA